MVRITQQTTAELFSALKDGKTLITASNRQAEFIHQKFRSNLQSAHSDILNDEHNKVSSTVWYRANIVTYQQWIKRLIESAQMLNSTKPPFLISKSHGQYIWESIIKQEQDPFLNTPLAARKAYSAAQILHQWQEVNCLDEDIYFEERLETRQFKRWYIEVNRICLEIQQLMPYQLEDYLLDLLQSIDIQELGLGCEIHTLGFQQPTPIQKQLFATLQDKGVQFKNQKPSYSNNKTERVEFKDIISELKHCALWSKQQYDKNPQQRIAIIVPELQQHRNRIKRYFSKVFQPQYWLDANYQKSAPFDISLAQKLSDYPMVNDLLSLLQLAKGKIENQPLQLLIQSPYLFKNELELLVAPLLKAIKNLRRPDYHHRDISKLLKQKIDAEFSQQSEQFSQVLQLLSDFSSTDSASPSRWSTDLLEVLEQINYATQEKLSSTEYQTKQKLINCIETLASFDAVVERLTWFEFFALLKKQCYSELFQPQTGDCPIQIMGLYEALSIEFDQIRMIGVDNNLWPSKTSPNPFLPYGLQKLKNMPNASATRELEICQQQYDSLQQHCDYLLLSHINDSAEQGHKLSPLIAEVALINNDLVDTVEQNSYQILSQQDTLKLNYVTDETVSPLMYQEVKGGSSLITDVARCQFRAFVHFRLKAKQDDQPKDDFDAMDKGNLVHHILEKLWRDHFERSQAVMKQKLNSAEFEPVLRQLVTDELLDANQQQDFRFSEQSIELERKRLMRLIKEWLQFETQREPFTVVATEEHHQAKLSSGIINLYIDRVDELEDGRRVILDYKTGQVDVKEWFGERPEQPQLPLYACVMNDEGHEIEAVSYACVKYQDERFKGVSEQARSLPGFRSAFAKLKYDTEAETIREQIPVWRENIESLMTEYTQGYAAVNRKDENTCRYCDLHGLCRIAEMSERPALKDVNDD